MYMRQMERRLIQKLAVEYSHVDCLLGLVLDNLSKLLRVASRPPYARVTPTKDLVTVLPYQVDAWGPIYLPAATTPTRTS